MSFNARVYHVMLASPSDVIDEKKLAREVIHEWNVINATTQNKCLLHIDWALDSSPEMDNHPQDILNKQVLDKADLLIGVFWTRVGTPTNKAISGTVEEIEKHISRGKPVMLYFSNAPVNPDNLDNAQHSSLKEFRRDCFSKGLVEKFNSLEEFRQKLSRQLALKIRDHIYFQSPEDNLPSQVEGIKYEHQDIFNNLSKIERQILKEASLDSDGTIIKAVTKEGLAIQTNNRQLFEDNNPKAKAEWSAALENLEDLNLIEPTGPSNSGMYSVTINGFKISEVLQYEQ